MADKNNRDEKSGVYIQEHLKIVDKTENKVLVNKRA
jgi:hypothetical protein